MEKPYAFRLFCTKCGSDLGINHQESIGFQLAIDPCFQCFDESKRILRRLKTALNSDPELMKEINAS